MTYKVALITGASSGIGKATAEKLAEKSYKLILLARRQERLAALKAELDAMTPCHIVVCDVNDHERLALALGALPDEFKAIDILVNNAGLALGTESADLADWDNWQTMIQTNCMSLAKLTRLILPGMVRRNRGHVINISSISGSYPYPGGNVYGATKAFVKQFSLNLKVDLHGTAVRVTNIEPGMVGGAEFSLVRFKGDSEKADAVYQNAEALTPSDIAASIDWVISQPAHVNINRLEVMPVCQAPAGLSIHRKEP